MASKLHDTKIHSIQVGNLSEPMRFTVGQDFKAGPNVSYKITRIERNENYITDGNGAPVYEVYASDNGMEFLFKYFERHPIYVSCALNRD